MFRKPGKTRIQTLSDSSTDTMTLTRHYSTIKRLAVFSIPESILVDLMVEAVTAVYHCSVFKNALFIVDNPVHTPRDEKETSETERE